MPSGHGPSSPRRSLLPAPWLVTLIAAAVVLVGAAAGPALVQVLWPKHVVHVVGLGGGPLTIVTRERTVAGALAAAGVKLGAKDQVTPDLDTPLADEHVIRIRQAVTVRVKADGQELDWVTAAPTVGDLLAELGVRLGERDRVEPGREVPVTGNLSVRVVRVTERLVTEDHPLPFDTVKREDYTLLAGETRELRAGEPGKAQVIVRERLEDGVVVAREPVEERVVRRPVDRVVAYGTAGVVSRGGVTYRYRKAMTMTATGYAPGDGMTPSDYTATGVPAKRGVVAVDPRVIPLGTRLYVEGYGPAVAADTGGAIKGMRIDLCFDRPQEAWDYGTQYGVKVYILD